MTWWFWGLIAWSTISTITVFWLVGMCARGRATTGPSPGVELGSLLSPTGDPSPAESEGSPKTPPAVATGAPAQGLREPAGPARAGGGTTVPLWPSSVSAWRGRPSARGSARTRALGHLIDGARAGDYTLPERLVSLHRAYESLQGFVVPDPPDFGPGEAAARLVSAAIDGRPLDPMGLCAEVHRSRTDRLLHQEALEVLDEAIGKAEDAAARQAGEASERIIVEHLRPAHDEVVHRAADLAHRLRRYTDERCELDTARIITASLKVRNAYLALTELVRRHRSILTAREVANALGERVPQHDRRGLFSVLRNPLAFAPPGVPYEEIPEPPVPENDTARLLWLVGGPGAVGRPWLPTAAEQDAAWWAQFGGPAPFRTAPLAETAIQDRAVPDQASGPAAGA